MRASVPAFKFKQLLLTFLPQAAALALKDRDEGIGSVFGQVLNIPDTCHPDNFPKDKYEYYSPEQNKDAPIMTSEAAHWFWGK